MSGRTIAAALLALLVTAPSASAHVEIAPEAVAPQQSILFEVRVPNERDDATTKVELEFPDGLVPFSFEEAPGWKRETREGGDGALQSVAWTGALPAGSFVRFSFLASTPDQLGTLTFRAVQTYADGTEVAWIGPPDSEEPAPTVEVTSSAQAATGEADHESAETAGPPGSTEAAEPATSAPEASAPPPTEAAPVSVTVDDDDSSTIAWTALAVGAIGAVAGLVALAHVLRRRTAPPDDDAW